MVECPPTACPAQADEPSTTLSDPPPPPQPKPPTTPHDLSRAQQVALNNPVTLNSLMGRHTIATVCGALWNRKVGGWGVVMRALPQSQFLRFWGGGGAREGSSFDRAIG